MSRLLIAQRLLTIFAVIAVGSPAVSAQDAAPRWKLKADDALKLKFDQKNSFNIKVMGQDIGNISELKLGMTWKVKSVNAGVAEIIQSIDTVNAHIQTQGMNIDFDSTKNEDPEDPTGKALSAIYRAVIGVPYTLSVKDTGEITAVKIPDSVGEALDKSPFKGMADAGSVFNEKGLKVMFKQILPILPDETLKKDGMLKPTTLSIPTGPFTMDLTYASKVVKLQDEIAQIDSDIQTKIVLPAESPLSIKLTKQKGSETFTFNLKEGLLKDSNIKQEFEMTLSVNNMDIDQSIALEASLAVTK